ncbi:15418_t:CDS:1, partial [Acaulospora colombiana]
HKYVMEDIHEGSLQQLRASTPPLNPIRMIRVALEVDSQELYQEAVNELAKTDNMVSLEEARHIGIEAFYEICSLQLKRERQLRAHAHAPPPPFSPFQQVIFQQPRRW